MNKGPVSTGNTGNQPFIARREVMMCCPYADYWAREVPQGIKERVCHELWPPEKLSRYLDMLEAFGFNSIQVGDLTQAYISTGVRPEDLRARDMHLLKAARERGMTATWFLWSNCCYDPGVRDSRVPMTRLRQCWHDPAERAFLEEYYRRQSDYAPYVDHLLTHWADPGGGKEGCGRCDYRGALELHNTIQDLFRKRNPCLRTTFSTWMLIDGSTWNRWPGLEKLENILHSGILAPDVGVALGLMNCGADGQRLDFAGRLKKEEVDAIRDCGRTAGIWCWYTTDNEIAPSLHVQTDILQNYFRSLVEPSGGRLDWHTVDDNCHGLNMPNLYVAGRLMQNPHEDARTILSEFLHRYFGGDAAPAAGEALRVIEKARGQSIRYATQVGDPSEALHLDALRETRELTGTASWRKSVLAMAEEAGKRLEHTGIRAGHTPSFPAPITPADYLDEVRVHLRAIAQLMRFLLEAEKVWNLIRRESSPEAIRTAIARLPEVERSDEHLVHLEWWTAQCGKDELLKKASAPTAGN